MSEHPTNAHRLLRIFEQMRTQKPSGPWRRMTELGLSHSHMRALHMLAPDRTMAMKDLAEELQLTPPSVTALTRRLVQTGMVQRQTHEEDSRVSLLSLTEEGRALLDALYHEQLRGMERLLHGLSDNDQRQLIDLLERAVRALREEV
ncbi:MAG TPA: MarR family transcriptional regulator [Roseiflexaceae bacterium]|nr:MarR family transcriptional regulator [Roseiflexaceae bacterium]